MSEDTRPWLVRGLPLACYSQLPSQPGQIIMIVRDERGYRPFGEPTTEQIAAGFVAEYNEKLGVTEAQQYAMEMGSIFGWDVPGATVEAAEEALARRYARD